ncbi:MAG: hypothetical protein ACLT8E_07020 [Akkermansia sp.]
MSPKGRHYMSLCVKLVREEKLLAPYRETFKRLVGGGRHLLENPNGKAPLDVPGRKPRLLFYGRDGEPEAGS